MNERCPAFRTQGLGGIVPNAARGHRSERRALVRNAGHRSGGEKRGGGMGLTAVLAPMAIGIGPGVLPLFTVPCAEAWCRAPHPNCVWQREERSKFAVVNFHVTSPARFFLRCAEWIHVFTTAEVCQKTFCAVVKHKKYMNPLRTSGPGTFTTGEFGSLLSSRRAC